MEWNMIFWNFVRLRTELALGTIKDQLSKLRDFQINGELLNDKRFCERAARDEKQEI